MLYRLYTERKNIDKIKDIATKYFSGFTILTGTGFWKGEKEESLILEITGGKEEKEKVKKLGKDIKKTNDQESILFQSLKNNSTFL